MATDQNFDEGVHRAWVRVGYSARVREHYQMKQFHWGMVDHDPLLVRQYYMMREGRHGLINMIRGDHGLDNKY
jgi:hypothetical protein